MSADDDRPTQPSELLRLAASGFDVDGIAKRLGISTSDAARQLARDVARARDELPELDDARVIERTHLLTLRRALMSAALTGDIAAMRMLVRVHQALAALLGLYEPLPLLDIDTSEEGGNELEQLRARRAARRAASS